MQRVKSIMKTKMATLFGAVLLVSGCSLPSTKYTDAPYVGGMYSKRVLVTYSGDLRPISEVGVLTQDAVLQIRSVKRNNTPVAVRQFSEKGYLYSTGRTQIHFAPGIYEVEFCFYQSSQYGTSWCTTTLSQTMRFVAGQVTHVEYSSGS